MMLSDYISYHVHRTAYNIVTVQPQSVYFSGSPTSDERVIDIFLIDDAITSDVIFVSFTCIFVIVGFGIVSNVISVFIYFNHGFKDTININLFALAISEICSLLPIIWAGVLSEPRFIPFEVWFSGKEVLFLAAGWPHAIFAKLTNWITAYIMFERCLCVALPLKVKMFLTPVRVKVCLLSISVLVLIGLLPTYMTHSLNWKCYPHLNRTILGLTLTDNALEVTHYTNFINNSVSALLSFIAILLCTLIIIFKLNQKTKWRNDTVKMDTKQSRNVYRKDRRAVKMVLTLSGIFLVSVAPSIIVIWANFLHAEFGMLNRYGNLFNISYCVTYVMESVSSSLNIVVYYKMNLQYRRTLRTMTSKLMGKIKLILDTV